jgi:hypothetical protein
VGTVVCAPREVSALANVDLATRAVDIVQPDLTTALLRARHRRGPSVGAADGEQGRGTLLLMVQIWPFF